MIFSKIRYKYINRIVNDIYIKQNICSFPINIINIINSLKDIKIKVISYSEFMKRYNLTKEMVFEALSSEDGCCDNFGDKYAIYYNDLNNLPQERINWTIAHELGHILCKHYNNRTRIFRNELSDEEYNFMECEANYFASMLLAHSAILLKLNIHNPYEIEVFCNLSSQASRYRYRNFKKWTSYDFITSSDRCITRNFKEYIDSKNQDYQEFLAFKQAFYR